MTSPDNSNNPPTPTPTPSPSPTSGNPQPATNPAGNPQPMNGPNGDLPELDPVIHAQARLRVVAALSQLPGGDRITFPRLQEILRMTAGNLSVHLRKLEEAGYVEVIKTHRGRTPATLVHLTQRGRFAFEEYVSALRTLIDPGEEPS